MEKLSKMKYVKLILLSIYFVTKLSHAQDKSVYTQFNGYLKYMQTLAFAPESDLEVNNLIHNRLNFAIETNHGSKFVVQVRNRILYGASVKTIPNYGKFINEYDGVLPFEFLIADNENVVISSIIDRCYYQYSNEKMQLRIGRQRINWGINTTWNPNDVFNSYNIYDFDYEEREGADAVRLTLFPNYMSSFDIAYKFTGDWKTDIVAALYKFNHWNYDFQFLAGKFQEKATLGTGWAGNLKTLGFKGEVTYFHALNSEDENNISATTSFDYSFSNGTYLMGTYLYNSSGTNEIIDPNTAIFEIPNAENLMPAQHNTMVQASYAVSPIFNTSLATVYSFGINSLSTIPSLTLSVMTNLDLDIIGQFFWQEITTAPFQNIGNGIYWRFKWSF